MLSTFPMSRSGWYRTAVESGSSASRRAPSWSSSARRPAAAQERQGPVGEPEHPAADGGTAAVTLDGIDIDRVKPVITLDGNRCTATDKLSGVKGRCHLHVGSLGHYRAVAVDRAGNRAVKRGVLD